MSAIKAVVFDAYGTLFDVTSIAGACRERFGAMGDQLCTLWRDKQLEYTWLRSLMGRYEDFDRVTAGALRYSCARLGLDIDDAGVKDLMERYNCLDTYPEVNAALAGLAGHRLMILSNGSPSMLSAVVGNNGLSGAFEFLISVAEAGVFKPDPRVYGLACTKTDLDTGEVAFVSSNYFDIAGAAAFGFHTVWVNRGGVCPDELGERAGDVLDNLEQLPALLEKL